MPLFCRARDIVRAPIFIRVFFVLTFCLGAFAQSDSSYISGSVADPSGSPVAGARIVVQNDDTNAVRNTTTNESGYYTVTNLPSGLYKLTAEAAGFKKLLRSNNKIDAAIPLTLNLSLQVGDVAESVNVVSDVANVQQDTATLGRTVTENQIKNIALNGRNPVYLALLKAGVTSSNTLSNFNFSTGLGGLNINGGRDHDNLLTYDGAIAVRSRAQGDSIGTVDLDAVQEVQVLTSNYPAEYGRSTGGQIRIVTKSGSSRFHGTVYEYFRNSALDANSWTRNTSPLTNFTAPFRFNQFGYGVNGPLTIPKLIPKNKVFFLFNQEYVRYRNEQTFTGSVPLESFRRGDYSLLLQPNDIYSRTPTRIIDPQTGAPFPNNVIPTSRLSPNGTALLNTYPLPTPGFQQGTNNFLQVSSNPQNQRVETSSLDVIPTENHYIRFRLNNFSYRQTDPYYATTFGLTPREFDRPNQTGSLGYVWTVNPTMTNELLISASHDRTTLGLNSSAGGYDRSQFGINYPYLFPNGKDVANKIPTIQAGSLGISTLDGGPYPSRSSGMYYTIGDTITKISGTHTIKAGFNFERAGQNDYDQISFSNATPGQTNNQNGKFEFSNSRPGGTGLGLANASLGLFTSYAEVGPRAYTPYRGNTYEWFVQDAWKATPKLRIEYGIRHTIIQPFYSLWNNLALFSPGYYDPANAVQVNPTTGNPVAGTGDPLNGTVFLGNGFTSAASGRFALADNGQADNRFRGLSRGYAETHLLSFQPRVGVAYAPNGKTVFRAGAGRYIARQGVSDGVFLGGNPPLQQVAAITNGLVDNPGAGGSVSSYPLATGTIDASSPQPESWAWNVSLERDLGFGTVLGVSYVGRRGLHGQLQRNINQPITGLCKLTPA